MTEGDDVMFEISSFTLERQEDVVLDADRDVDWMNDSIALSI